MPPDGARPSFVLIYGPSAVGKLTVGKALAELTGYRIVHNHLAIENALALHPFGSPEYTSLVAEVRRLTFESAAHSRLPGLIFTFVWNFVNPAGTAMVSEWCGLFRAHAWTICFLELRADLATRLERNRDASRIAEKPSKRDIAASERWLLDNEAHWTMNLPDGSPPPVVPDHYLCLNTQTLAPEDAAAQARVLFRI